MAASCKQLAVHFQKDWENANPPLVGGERIGCLHGKCRNEYPRGFDRACLPVIAIGGFR
jgi:hypothetical protein